MFCIKTPLKDNNLALLRAIFYSMVKIVLLIKYDENRLLQFTLGMYCFCSTFKLFLSFLCLIALFLIAVLLSLSPKTR